MRRKPKGPKYRNLTARSGVIYYQRVAGGKRIRFSCETRNWNEAAAVRDLYEEKRNISRFPSISSEVPTFAEFAKRYLDEDTQHLAATTRSDRDSYLREEGPLMAHFGARRLDEISRLLVQKSRYLEHHIFGASWLYSLPTWESPLFRFRQVHWL